MKEALLTLSTPIHWLFLTLVLLAVGSFLNVVISRIPAAVFAELEGGDSPEPIRQLFWPPSRCPGCKASIRWHDNLPVLGWLICQGRCRDCHQRIGWRYPTAELLMAAAGVCIAARFGLTAEGLGLVLLSAWLISLALIDLETRLLPDLLTLSGLWLGLLAACLGLYVSPTEAIAGAAAGYGLLALPNALYRLWRGHDGMGGGDFKLMALLGAWLGPQALPAVTLLAAGGGLLQAALLTIAGRRQTGQSIAFGPWLAAAGWFTVVWGYEWSLS